MRTRILHYADMDRCPPARLFPAEPSSGEAAAPSGERALYRRILEVGIRTQLPEGERRLVELCYREGYTVEDAARLLRVDRSTAFRRLCRARSTLRRFAGGCLEVAAQSPGEGQLPFSGKPAIIEPERPHTPVPERRDPPCKPASPAPRAPCC